MSAAHERLRRAARRLDDAPGTYRFYDAGGALLYVGKAKSLRKRVGSYFGAAAQKQPRTRLMAGRIDRIDVTVTPTEADALVLEHEQINSLKPRYNVYFRDDKSYPYLRITDHRYPRVASHRGKPDGGCHGPYPSAWAVGESVRVLQQAFRIRTCKDSDFATRTRPCLLHQIGRCSAPCVGLIGEKEYGADVDRARRFVRGGDGEVVAELTARMEEASGRRDYEEAARFRDSIKALADIRHESAVTGGAPEADFIGLHAGDGGVAVRLVAVRGGRCVGEIDFFPENADGVSADEVLGSFVAQHYRRHRLPARVVARCGLEPAALERLAGGGKARFVTRPQGGERKRVELACENAAAALRRRDLAAGEAAATLERLAGLLEIPPPARIDCIDVSHSMGEEAVASCVVCAGGVMDKRLYRRYRLRKAPGGDDYAGIRETVSRRYRGAGEDPSVLPGLVVIDGGAGQVSAVNEALDSLQAGQTPVLGIAKGPERKPGAETLITGHGEILEVPPADAAFRLLQRMRDEAHRFALAGHRRRRDRKRRASALEEIEGIGPSKRRALVNEFGGLQGLKRASVSDLSRIRGVGGELARRIYRALHT